MLYQVWLERKLPSLGQGAAITVGGLSMEERVGIR